MKTLINDIIIFTPKTPLKTIGQIKLELLDKNTKYRIALVLLQSNDIILSEFMKIYE